MERSVSVPSNMNIKDYVMANIGPEGRKLVKDMESHSMAVYKKQRDMGIAPAIGSHITYEITPTSIGEIIKVKCDCGKSRDLTDYKSL